MLLQSFDKQIICYGRINGGDKQIKSILWAYYLHKIWSKIKINSNSTTDGTGKGLERTGRIIKSNDLITKNNKIVHIFRKISGWLKSPSWT